MSKFLSVSLAAGILASTSLFGISDSAEAADNIPQNAKVCVVSTYVDSTGGKDYYYSCDGAASAQLELIDVPVDPQGGFTAIDTIELSGQLAKFTGLGYSLKGAYNGVYILVK